MIPGRKTTTLAEQITQEKVEKPTETMEHQDPLVGEETRTNKNLTQEETQIVDDVSNNQPSHATLINDLLQKEIMQEQYALNEEREFYEVLRIVRDSMPMDMQPSTEKPQGLLNNFTQNMANIGTNIRYDLYRRQEERRIHQEKVLSKTPDWYTPIQHGFYAVQNVLDRVEDTVFTVPFSTFKHTVVPPMAEAGGMVMGAVWEGMKAIPKGEAMQQHEAMMTAHYLMGTSVPTIPLQDTLNTIDKTMDDYVAAPLTEALSNMAGGVHSGLHILTGSEVRADLLIDPVMMALTRGTGPAFKGAGKGFWKIFDVSKSGVRNISDYRVVINPNKMPSFPGNIDVKKVGKAHLDLKDGMEVKVDNALEMAEKFLGKGYIDKGKGRFVSLDGKRQVRMGDGDILGHHAGGRHMNFEKLRPDSKTLKMKIEENIHVFLKDK